MSENSSFYDLKFDAKAEIQRYRFQFERVKEVSD